MGELRPFSEDRSVVSSVDVSLSRSSITPLPVQLQENVSSFVLPGFEPNGKVNIHIREKGATGYYFFEVHVEGLPLDADVWIQGQFEWRVRNFDETGTSIRTGIPLLPCPVTWLRGNGCVGSFIFSHTQEIVGKVKVYGAVKEEASESGPVPDLRTLRQHTALCDVVLRAAGKDFPAHRIVLAARSPVLLAMFTADFKEARDKEVDIAVDCPAEVFGVFVDFLYSGVLHKKSCGHLLHLLELGERHLVLDLKEQCVRQLLAVGADDALEVLQASVEKPFVPKECREHAIRLVRSNWQSIYSSEEWSKFSAAQPVFALAVECMMSTM